jgi:hypothetical protein
MERTTCAHVPEIYHQTLDPETGALIEDIGPILDYRYLETPETLVEFKFCDDLNEAKRSCKAVRALIAAVGVKELKKLKLSRPEMETILLDYKYKKATKPGATKTVVPKERTTKKASTKKAAVKLVALKATTPEVVKRIPKFTRTELF